MSNGQKDLSKKFTTLAENAKRLDGQHSIPVTELLSSSFVAACSKFQSAEELFNASGFKIESPEDFKAIPDFEWDAFIKENTHYSNWSDMLQAAAAIWTKKKLGL